MCAFTGYNDEQMERMCVLQDEHGLDVIRFSQNQELPWGYEVVWAEYTEHYHWICPNFEDDWELSLMYSSRWDARRSCLNYIESLEKENK